MLTVAWIRFGFCRHEGECICSQSLLFKIVLLFDFFRLLFCTAVKTCYGMFDVLFDLRLYMVSPATLNMLKSP